MPLLPALYIGPPSNLASASGTTWATPPTSTTLKPCMRNAASNMS